MSQGKAVSRKRPRRPPYTSSIASTSSNPLSIVQFEESLSGIFPNIKFTRGAVEALRCIQEDFVQWIAVSTIKAADEQDEAQASKANYNKVAAIKQQDVLDALVRETSPSSVLPVIADQTQQILQKNYTDPDSGVVAEAGADSSKKVNRRAKKSKQGRPVFSQEMEAAQERLLQGSRQKMTETKP